MELPIDHCLKKSNFIRENNFYGVGVPNPLWVECISRRFSKYSETFVF